MDKLDWIEQIARGNLNARGENADLIRSQANTMLAELTDLQLGFSIIAKYNLRARNSGFFNW